MRRAARHVLAVAIAVAFALVPTLAGDYRTNLTSQVLIFAILAMSIDILAGFAGRTSLCHGAIFGVATYVVLYLSGAGGVPLWLAALAAIGAGTLVAALFALLAVRTSGAYFLLLTLALGMVVWGICLRWTSVTGGENGIRATIRPSSLASATSFYWFTCLVFVVLAAVMWRFVTSPFGLTLKGIRDGESRMQALGYGVALHLFIGFVVSGFFASVAGVLYGLFNGFVSPSTVAVGQSTAALLMAIVGGVGTLFGGLIGAAIVTGVEDVVSTFTDRWAMAMGLLFIAAMIFAPEGVLGLIRARLERRYIAP